MTHRNQKVASTLTRALQQVLAKGLQDPRTFGSLITVTGVDLSPDGRNATVSVSVLPEQAQSKVHAALSHSSGYIRREAAELLHLKIMPALSFSLDTSLKRQAGVLGALGKVAQERAEGPTSEEPDGQHTTDGE